MLIDQEHVEEVDGFDAGWDSVEVAEEDAPKDAEPDGGNADDKASAAAGEQTGGSSDPDSPGGGDGTAGDDKSQEEAQGAESDEGKDTFEQKFEALQAQVGKYERDHKAEIGRLKQQNQQLQATIAQQNGVTGKVPGATTEPDTETAGVIASLKELDPDLGSGIEKLMAAQDARLERALGTIDELSNNLSGQVGKTARDQGAMALDALMPEIPWRDIGAVDENGDYAHEGFREFVETMPMRDYAAFHGSEDPKVVADVITSYHESLNGSSAKDPPPGDAGGGQAGARSNGKAVSQKRNVQRTAVTRTPSGGSARGGGEEDADDFDAGWSLAASQEKGRFRPPDTTRGRYEPDW